MIKIINKNLLFLVGIMLFLVFAFVSPVFASNTYGSIDSTYKYAWSENTGWINFGTSNGNVHVTDSGLSGYALSENVGWIYLGGVLNDSNGNLSGLAWGENIGWIKFNPTNGGVVINSSGVFTGSALGENIGWITFGTGDNKVITDWRPVSARPHGGGIPLSVLQAMNERNRAEQVTTTPLPNVSTTPNQTSYNLGTVTLKNGSKGEPVKELQRFLNKVLKLNIAVDGKFGPKTFATIKKWQKANGLKADGIVGPKTREKMNTLVF